MTLRQKQEAIANFGSTRHIERLRRKLLQLARDYGRVARDGVRIDFPLSHTLLADMVGSSRETVTRSLDELQRDGDELVESVLSLGMADQRPFLAVRRPQTAR